MLYHNRCFKFYEGVDSVHNKIVAECIKKSVYEKGDFKIEPYENWIDIGSNIGCFSFRAKMNGANVLKMIEPDPKNNEIAKWWFNQRKIKIPEIIDQPVDVDVKEVTFYRNPERPYFNSMKAGRNKTESWEVMTFPFQQLIEKDICIKMDIEGAEIPIIDNCDFTGVKKMVVAYHIEADRSKANLIRRIKRLEQFFNTVVCGNNVDKLPEKMRFFPNEIFIWCFNV